MLQNLRLFRLTKWSFFVHSTVRNAPYVHPRLDSIIELCWIFSNALGMCFEKKMSMTKLCHRKEETQNTNTHSTNKNYENLTTIWVAYSKKLDQTWQIHISI